MILLIGYQVWMLRILYVSLAINKKMLRWSHAHLFFLLSLWCSFFRPTHPENKQTRYAVLCHNNCHNGVFISYCTGRESKLKETERVILCLSTIYERPVVAKFLKILSTKVPNARNALAKQVPGTVGGTTSVKPNN